MATHHITIKNPLAGLFAARSRPAFLQMRGRGAVFVRYSRSGPVQSAQNLGACPSVGAELASLHLPGGQVLSLVLCVQDHAPGQVSLALAGSGGVPMATQLLEGLAWESLTWEQALAHQQVRNQIKAMAACARPWWGWGRVAAAVLVTAVLLVLLLAQGSWSTAVDPASQSWGKAPSAPAAAAQVGATGASAEVQAAAKTDLLDDADRKILGSIVAESGIALDPKVKGKPFVVFSDPQCPACKALETTLQGLDRQTWTPIIVPVAFKEGSAGTVARVLCSKDVAAAWQLVMNSTVDLSADACTKGQSQAQSNNAAFVALRFHSTPTLVAPNGRVISGAGTVEQLAAWLRDNS